MFLRLQILRDVWTEQEFFSKIYNQIHKDNIYYCFLNILKLCLIYTGNDKFASAAIRRISDRH